MHWPRQPLWLVQTSGHPQWKMQLPRSHWHDISLGGKTCGSWRKPASCEKRLKDCTPCTSANWWGEDKFSTLQREPRGSFLHGLASPQQQVSQGRPLSALHLLWKMGVCYLGTKGYWPVAYFFKKSNLQNLKVVLCFENSIPPKTLKTWNARQCPHGIFDQK